MNNPRIFSGGFPMTRLRRMRQFPWLRKLVSETKLSVDDLIWPLFIHEHEGSEPIASMPGVERLGIAGVVRAVGEARALGIPAVALFPVVDASKKNEEADESFNENNLICRATRAIRKEHGDSLGVICDVALDPYTSHGHDGLVRNGQVVNDETVEVLVRQSLSLAAAGCHMIAPSDMMDGRVAAIRRALDNAGRQDVGIISYAAKYASAFYGPFRDAIGSVSALGATDKKTYQMDPANVCEALREVAMDLEEGADIVMVKPAGTSLDIIAEVRKTFLAPTFAYQVSGEYAMIRAASDAGWIDGPRAMLESLLVIKRAGADGILTYFAPEAARRLAEMRS